jgi:hypothetical protein
MTLPSEEVILKPRTSPRDGLDVVVTLASSATALAAIVGVPFLIAWLLSGRDVWTGLYCGGGAFLLFSIVNGPRTIVALRIDAQGISLRRALLPQRLIEWPQITEVRPAARGEAVRNFFDPWGFTMNGTTLDTFRIVWIGGAMLFAPADVNAFRHSIHRWRPDLIAPAAAMPRDATQLLPPAEETGNPYQSPKSDLIDPGLDE